MDPRIGISQDPGFGGISVRIQGSKGPGMGSGVGWLGSGGIQGSGSGYPGIGIWGRSGDSGISGRGLWSGDLGSGLGSGIWDLGYWMQSERNNPTPDAD